MARITAEQHQARLALYDKGLSDSQIAAEQHTDRSAIYQWRKVRGLPRKHGPMTPEQDRARLLLYQLGHSDRRISREQGIHESAVWHWRQRRGLAPNAFPGWTPLRHLARADTVLDRIKRAIRATSGWLTPDQADDAIADLYVAVLEGRVDLEKVEAEARRFGNRVVSAFASKFGPRSLDEELGDDDGFRMIDMLRDERSSGWLEEMGATAW